MPVKREIAPPWENPPTSSQHSFILQPNVSLVALTSLEASRHVETLSSYIEEELTRESGSTYDYPIRSNACINLCFY